MDNFYISGQEGSNQISQYFLDREHTLFFVVRFSDPEDETMTHGIPDKFAILNGTKKGTLLQSLSQRQRLLKQEFKEENEDYLIDEEYEL